MVATPVARNVNARPTIGATVGGVWQSLRLAFIWSQEVGFVLVRLAGI
jgi:hypothetical protein